MVAKPKAHDRYKVEILSQESVIRTLGIPANRSRFHVLEITRRELRSIPTVTHAVIRGLDGEEHVIYAADGWWRCQIKAFKL